MDLLPTGSSVSEQWVEDLLESLDSDDHDKRLKVFWKWLIRAGNWSRLRALWAVYRDRNIPIEIGCASAELDQQNRSQNVDRSLRQRLGRRLPV